MRDVVTNNANCKSRALDRPRTFYLESQIPLKIVLTHSLEQQEAAIGFPSVGDPVRPFRGNRVAVTDVDNSMIARSRVSTASFPARQKYQSVTWM